MLTFEKMCPEERGACAALAAAAAVRLPFSYR